jgi:hypothetical protein
MNKNLLLVVIVFFSLHHGARATIVTGKVTDTASSAISYASVYVEGTTKGTTTNFSGVYALDLQPGNYSIIFRILGFKSTKRQVKVSDKKIVLNVVLKEENMELKEVTVRATEDPAYAMIRSAMKMRKHYLEQVNSYSCDVYIKGLQRLMKHPKKLLGHDISDDDLDIIDTVHKIVYLSESVSKFNFKQPDNIKEEMISSKVSGDSKGFSYNSASDLLFNFYETVMQVQGLSERGFISPIAPDAMLYYKYRLRGTYQENGVTVDKIEVLPRRKNDPVFRGFIYLEESGWRIYSTDLYLTKDAQIDFVDTLVVDQTYIPVNEDVWMPFSNKFLFHIGMLGFKANGVYVGVNSNYNINPKFPKHFFNGEDLNVDSTANKKDSLYWRDTRPVPLTDEEVEDYHKRDSIMAIRNSKKYLDSVDKKQNKFKPGGFILGGYNYSNRYKKYTLGISGLLEDIQYNTVQGLVLGANFYFFKRLEHNRSYSISPGVNYGLSDKRINASASFYYNYKPEKFSYVSVDFGRTTSQFDRSHGVMYLINEFYTLFDKTNFAKYYQSDRVNISHSTELINGVQFATSLKYEIRSPLQNTSFFSFVKKDKTFSSNDPQQVVPEGQPSFNSNNALIFSEQVTIHFKQRYYTRPYEKIVQESKYPKLQLYYKKGFSNVLGSDVNFDYLQASLSGKFNLKMLGHSEWSVTGGKFVNNRTMYFMDYYHFNANQTIFSNLGGFELLPYYRYSTNEQFVTANFEHHFGGFILNKFPLIRKLKLGEIAGVNYITSNTLHQYVELYVGIEKFRTFNAIFVTGFSEGQKTLATFRFGISMNGNISISI